MMLELILQNASTLTFDPKDTVIEQDEPCNGLLYVILSGEFLVYRDHQLILKITRPGQMLGEMSVLTHELRSAAIIANTPSQVVAIDASFLVPPFFKGGLGGISETAKKGGEPKNTQALAFLTVFSRVLTEKLKLTNEKAKLYEDALLETKEAERLSITDGLTGIFNRRYYDQFAKAQIARANPRTKPCSMILLDIDNFKKYNDTNGHQLGDEVLKKVAKVLKEGVRHTDMVARYGGEEFVIVLPNTDKHAASLMAEKLRKAVEQEPFPNEETQPLGRLTASFGVATAGENGKTPEAILKNADHCLYLAKEKGRNGVVTAERDVTLANPK